MKQETCQTLFKEKALIFKAFLAAKKTKNLPHLW